MSSPKPIFLKPGMTIVFEGREITTEELQDYVVDGMLYRKNLEKQIAKAK